MRRSDSCSEVLNVQEAHHPLSWMGYDYTSLARLQEAIHCSYRTLLGILKEENVLVKRVVEGKATRYFIYREAAEKLIAKHGTDRAREQRMKRSAAKPRLSPPWWPCPYCRQKGRQWRGSFTSAGNRG